MNILIINGSPKGSASNSMKLTHAFVEGMNEVRKLQTKVISVDQLNISSCRGCFSCWKKTPGKCVIHDDMEKVIEALLWADLTIWSFPLYYFGLPGKLKILMDRQLPMALPFMTNADGGGHPSRYDTSNKRTVLISTCGFYTAEHNYDAVRTQFDRLCGKDGYAAIFCGEGELFRVPELKQRTDAYLNLVKEAGKQYAGSGITNQLTQQLSIPLYPRELFERMADASWGISSEGEKEDESLIFTRQMAALYDPAGWPGKDVVFDMDYTDIQKRYQVILGKEKSTVTQDLRIHPDTIIHTPFTVWKDLGKGKYSGPEALMKHLYTVEGDFQLMLNWDTYFPSGAGKAEESQTTTNNKAAEQSQPRTTMAYLLIPWIFFWTAVPVQPFYGSILSIAACALLPMIFYRNAKTIYDVLSAAAVSCLAMLIILGVSSAILVPVSYFLFGLMWFISVFLPIPLTSCYSKNDYGGDSALNNPMFIKTNRILTALWGIFYMATSFVTFLIMHTEAGFIVSIVNSILPAALGIFTSWFQKWYPAKIAEGKY